MWVREHIVLDLALSPKLEHAVVVATGTTTATLSNTTATIEASAASLC